MALQAAYKQFLAAPSSSLLASDATLHYVTTTTSYRGATDIIKHLNTLSNQVKKKKEDVLTVIEGQDAAAIEIGTTLEFVTSGASYLPGLDDNFLADRTVHLPIVSPLAASSSVPRPSFWTLTRGQSRRCTLSRLTPRARLPRFARAGTRARC
jgi:hypothetical protein